METALVAYLVAGLAVAGYAARIAVVNLRLQRRLERLKAEGNNEEISRVPKAA